MKSHAVIALLVLAAASVALADIPGADWLTREQVTAKLGMGV